MLLALKESFLFLFWDHSAQQVHLKGSSGYTVSLETTLYPNVALLFHSIVNVQVHQGIFVDT